MTSVLHPMPAVPRDTTRRIGLLGGSFNPAHDGHRHISLEALKRLDLDEVWWLVSPQNPLKSDDGMEPLASRLAGASLVLHPEPARQSFRHGDPRRASQAFQSERKDHFRTTSASRSKQAHR